MMMRWMGVHSSAPFLSALVTSRSQKRSMPSAARVRICFETFFSDGTMAPVRGATSLLGGSHRRAATGRRCDTSMVLVISARIVLTSSLPPWSSSPACPPLSFLSFWIALFLAPLRFQYRTCPLAHPAASRSLFSGLNLKQKMSPGALRTNWGWMGSRKFQMRMCDVRTLPSMSTCSSSDTFSVHATATVPLAPGIQSMHEMILFFE
mmetsp:Transcript_6843/g.15691  ORF Transcript_6843/g.15691 Transcript_6843/m.15691 type:complete len:207 (-) Transcript_6843:1271-1891(-)